MITRKTVAEGIVGGNEIGAHCFYCHQLDFLPFDCQYCKKRLCLKHWKPEQHECSKYRELRRNEHFRTLRSERSQSDSKATFSKLTESARLQQQEGLVNVRAIDQAKIQEKASNPKALSLLAKLRKLGMTDPLRTKRNGGKLTDKAKKAVRLQAKRLDPKVPISDCTYVTVSPKDKKDGMFAVPSDWKIGRALDKFAQEMTILNVNAMTADPSKKLSLVLVGAPGSGSAGGVQLAPGDRFGALVGNYSTILIVRGLQSGHIDG